MARLKKLARRLFIPLGVSADARVQGSPVGLLLALTYTVDAASWLLLNGDESGTLTLGGDESGSLQLWGDEA